MATLVGSIPEPEPENTPPTYAEQVEAYRHDHKEALTNVASAVYALANNEPTIRTDTENEGKGNLGN